MAKAQGRATLGHMSKDPGLDAAYALTSNAEIRALYRDWAGSYDDAFIKANGYRLPDLVASAFKAAGGRGPVLDVGAGTGAVAERLADVGIGPIDALDLSQEMLDVAAAKGLYRALYAADVLKPLSSISGHYSGIVSAGTFTHGHVGPDALDHLMAITVPGAVFALSINAQHFEARGFAAKLDALGVQITDLQTPEAPIYTSNPDPAHQADRAKIVTFVKR